MFTTRGPVSFQKIFRVHRDSEIDTFLGIADREQAEKKSIQPLTNLRG